MRILVGRFPKPRKEDKKKQRRHTKHSRRSTTTKKGSLNFREDQLKATFDTQCDFYTKCNNPEGRRNADSDIQILKDRHQISISCIRDICTVPTRHPEIRQRHRCLAIHISLRGVLKSFSKWSGPLQLQHLNFVSWYEAFWFGETGPRIVMIENFC